MERNNWESYQNSNIGNRCNESCYSRREEVKDTGPCPLVTNLERLTKENRNFRTTLWTGEHLQVTLMRIGVGESIGLERHGNVDQMLRIEQGMAFVQMGDEKNHLDFQRRAGEGYAIFIPANTWHNVTNIGNVPLKVYSVYAPPQHPKGTVHRTKKEAEEE